MSRCLIIAELATGHGGDVLLAEDMIRAAADAGADYAKIQTFSLERLNPADPQASWLRQAHLDEAAHVRLMDVCEQVGIKFLSTPCDVDSLQMLRRLGLTTFKIASSESGNSWWVPDDDERWIVSWPWGVVTGWKQWRNISAIPLYPTPLECVGRAKMLDGVSDHTEGIDVCLAAIACGAEMLEKHLTLPGRSRERSWDATPEQFARLRQFAETCATVRSGISEQFRTRWSA